MLGCILIRQQLRALYLHWVKVIPKGEFGNKQLDIDITFDDDVAEQIGYSVSSVGRLVRNLSVQLPEGQAIFAVELIPGISATSQKGAFALKQLQGDPALYEGGKWKVSARELVPILRRRFRIEAARRTVAKYQGMLR